MKELTIEQKAKAYDEAISLIKDYNRDEEGFICVKPENIFPELEESEDERIRKWLIAQLQIKIGDNATLNNMIYKAIAWLEKQGKVPVTIDVNKMVRDYANNKECGNERFGKPVNCMIRAYRQGITDTISILHLEKQGEQKPQGKTALEAINEEKVDNSNKAEPKDYNSIDPHFAKPADKVEPKFHKGQWVACEGLNTAFIVNIDDDKFYEVEFIDGGKGFPHIDYVDKLFHLWTIQDAKDGNMLVSRNGKPFIYNGKYNNYTVGAYCGVCGVGIGLFGGKKGTGWSSIEGVTPATKEQRDTLMKAMADAGYTFDFDKKVLKKIEKSKTW